MEKAAFKGMKRAIDLGYEGNYEDIVHESRWYYLTKEDMEQCLDELGKSSRVHIKKEQKNNSIMGIPEQIQEKPHKIHDNVTFGQNKKEGFHKKVREIFISYSKYDKALVHPFTEYISREVGRECWIDLTGIESGSKFERIIQKAIDDCKVVLFMLSDKSLESEWTEREVHYAEKHQKRIVPVVVEGNGLRGWFDFHFGNVDYININSEEQKKKLVENLRTWLEVKGAESQTDTEKQKDDEDEATKKQTEEYYQSEDILQKLGLYKKSEVAKERKRSIFDFEIVRDSVEVNWDKFIDAIIYRQVVLVVGPSIIRVGNESFVQSFIEAIAKGVGIENCKITSLDQLVFHENFFKYGRNNIHSLLSSTLAQYESYVDKNVDFGILLRLLHTRCFPFVLTTTIDGMLEKKMRELYGDNLSILMFDNNPRHIASTGDIRKESDLSKPTLYYMYGKASKNSFVVTDDDLRSFSKSWLSEDIAPKVLSYALRHRYLLFLGYDYRNGIDSFFLQDLRLSGESITRPQPIYEFIQLIEKGLEQCPDLVVNEIVRRIEEKEKAKFDFPQRDYDVYISYSRSDREIADKLYDSLTKLGLQVWYDKKNLSIVSDYMDEIRDAIRTARYFVPILSRNITKEKNEARMYRREWNEASEHAKGMGRTFIIPIVEEGFDFYESNIPEEMTRHNPIYYSEESNFEDVAEKIFRIINRD